MGDVIDFPELRQRVQTLLVWACDDGSGARGTSDPVYRVVDSNADARRRGLSLYEVSVEEHWQHRHSSCAILAHWLLEVLGVTFPWVGRETQHVNPLTRLAYTAAQSRAPKPDEVLELGDVCLIGDSPATCHIFVVLHHDPDAGELVVAEYGQPGGHVAKKTMRRVGKTWMVGARPLERVLPLEDLMRAAHAAGKLAGAIAWPEGCPEAPKDLEAKTEPPEWPAGTDNEGKTAP